MMFHSLRKSPARRIGRVSTLSILASLVLIVGSFCSNPLFAVDDGEMIITVTDEAGKPMRDVQVVITSDEDPEYHKEVKTNKKGRFVVRVFYAKLAYKAVFTKEGYETTGAMLQPKVGGKVRFTVEMAEEGSATPPPAATPPPIAGGISDEAVKLFNEGLQAGKDGDAVTAEARLKAALEIAPGLSQAHAALTILYFEADRNKEAATEVEAWLGADPGNATALRIQYEVQKALGDEQAILKAKTALEQADPKLLADSLVEEGRKLFNAGDQAGAKDLLTQALEKNPDAPRAHYLLGLCAVSEENPDEARAHIERFLELAPDDPEAATAKELLGML